VLALLRARAEGGAGVVIVTHSPAVAAAADRTVALLDGRVVGGDGLDRAVAAS
jgi:putative ABC transport system ATP-binding protein